MPVLHPERLIQNRRIAIRQIQNKSGQPMAEVDVSGGIDSAVIVALAAEELGPENVIPVHSAIHSDPKALSRAQEVCDHYGLRLVCLDLTSLYEGMVAQIRERAGAAGWDIAALDARWQKDPTVGGSIRSTLRAPVGRACNRMLGGGIRHGTGNEDEDRFLRFYQKGGDGEVDTNPIAMLSKGETYQLAVALGVPRSVLEARPSPDLWGIGEEHNDESEIGNYLGFQPQGQHFYSYVDPDTGVYRNVGLIERTSRFLDRKPFPHGATYGERLFHDDFDCAQLDAVIRNAYLSDEFHGVVESDVKAMLLGARRVERITRHKMNPNCPTLGSREELVAAGLLTNTLPTR